MNGIAYAGSSAQLQQCTELEYILLGDLREMLEEPLTPVSRQWMLAVLDVLLETLPREHRLKSSSDGYLSEVLLEFPNWSPHVDRLEAEHFDLYDRLWDLRDELEGGASARSAASALRFALRDWMEAFLMHRRDESALLMDAVNTEIGGGD
jgi:hypothetical protein